MEPTAHSSLLNSGLKAAKCGLQPG
jgi:hypothetical protein